MPSAFKASEAFQEARLHEHTNSTPRGKAAMCEGPLLCVWARAVTTVCWSWGSSVECSTLCFAGALPGVSTVACVGFRACLRAIWELGLPFSWAY